MKNKILLLDIDGTIYDVPKSRKMFENDLCKKIDINKSLLIPIIEQSFQDIKKLTRYFEPSVFVKILSSKLNINNKKEIEKSIWNIDKFNKCLYYDSKLFINSLYKNLNLIIFSTGDKAFQTLKLNSIKKYIKKNNIYIYKDKKLKFKGLLNKLKDHKIFIIDDSPDVINKAKEVDKNIVTILIKRKDLNKKYNYSQTINADYKVKNLMSAVKIIKSN